MSALKPIIPLLLMSLSATCAWAQEKPLQKHSIDTLQIQRDSLQAVTVTAPMRPRVRGDTLEYNTEHIRMRPNAVVEDLLRRLPGLQVDANGNIIYNGEHIEHLLVNGEDIFGSAPTLVTRNFDASKIARVQILDRKSDQAVFTGIDDGTRTKTLNLVLKESSTHGYFAKAEVGANTNGYNNSNGILAAFRGKKQFTALALSSNTGMLGFNSNSENASNSITFSAGNMDPLNASAGSGIPQFTAAALHYANTWNGVQDHLSANYQYSHYFTNPVTNSITVQTQLDTVYGQLENSHSHNQQIQHWMQGSYEWVPTKFSAFKLFVQGSNSQGQNQYAATSSGSFNNTLVNTNQRTIQDKVKDQTITASAAWRTQVAHRTKNVFSVTMALSKLDNLTTGFLYSLSRYYQFARNPQETDTIDQRKQIVARSININASINYSQVLWRGATVGLSYAPSLNQNDPLQATFARGNGKYEAQVDSLSGSYRNRTINQQLLVNLQGKLNHITYLIGITLFSYDNLQTNLSTDSTTRIHNISYIPRLFLNYAPDPVTNLSIRYKAFTEAPSATDLRPLINNSNPLAITLGNPNLKPAVSQTLNLDFHRLKTWLIGIGLNLGLTTHTISTKSSIDSLGRQISQPVNVNGVRSAGLSSYLSRKLFGVDVTINTAGAYSQTVNYVNSNLNRNNEHSSEAGLNLNKYVEGKYSLQITTRFTKFYQLSSINPEAPLHYWSQSHSASLTLLSIRNVQINTTAVYTWQQKASSFAGNASVVLCNAVVSRNFLDRKLIVSLQLNNITNANAGIIRTNTTNINTQTSTNVLARYWMLSVIYHFDSKFRQK